MNSEITSSKSQKFEIFPYVSLSNTGAMKCLFILTCKSALVLLRVYIFILQHFLILNLNQKLYSFFFLGGCLKSVVVYLRSFHLNHSALQMSLKLRPGMSQTDHIIAKLMKQEIGRLLRTWGMCLVVENQAFQWKWRHIWYNNSRYLSTYIFTAQSLSISAKTTQSKRLILIKSDQSGYMCQCELHWIYWWIVKTELRIFFCDNFLIRSSMLAQMCRTHT